MCVSVHFKMSHSGVKVQEQLIILSQPGVVLSGTSDAVSAATILLSSERLGEA